jgi:hypothetical protein
MAPEFLIPKNSNGVVVLPYSTKIPLWHSQYLDARVEPIEHKHDPKSGVAPAFGISYSMD